MIQTLVKRILKAKVYAAAIQTPLDPAKNLSARIGNHIWLKREDLQPVFSFKIRGAYNKMAQLTDAEKAKGVICASAGNHAQGLAESAKLMGVKAVIVMPKTTPDIKVQAVRSRGAKVILHGDAYDDALTHSIELTALKGYTYVHPYDDLDVMAGQGTIAMELMSQHQNIDAVFIPVGGGGLISGMAAYIKYLHPEIKIIGVEFEESASLTAALAAGKPVRLPQVGIFADGIAVAQVGEHPWNILKDHVDQVITVSADEICAAIKDVFDDTRSVAEPAGATSIAGLKKYVEQQGITDQNLVAICSGANVNFDRLRYIAERAEVGEHREAILAVTIPEKPGSYHHFINMIGKRSITEFNYRYSHSTSAQIFVGIQISGNEDRYTLIARLQEAGYATVDLTEDDLAKSHIRHMVGGHSQDTDHECIYRFEFPERPGALLNFLQKLGRKFNISLFHYRNHGAADGRVLCGMQVPPKDQAEFKALLDELGYPYWDETDNPAYRLFLG